jgi:hypothetical protein
VCDLCHDECGGEGRGELFDDDVMGAAFVAFGAVEHVVSVDIVEFVAFAFDGIWDDWESEFSTGSDLEVYGWESVGLIAS